MPAPATSIQPAKREDRAAFGIALMLMAYLMFSFIDTSVKWLAIAGIPALQLSFMRYFGHFIISTTLVGREALNGGGLGGRQLGLVALRSLLLMLSTVLNFFALHYLPLTLTSTILFSAPIWVCVLSWPLLGERVGVWRWGAIMLGFVGILFAVRPFDEGFHPAAIASVLSALSFALYSILTRRLAGEVSTNMMQFFTGLVGVVALAPFAVWTWTNPETGAQWVLLFSLGFWGWAGHQLLTNAFRFATASTLSPYSYSFIIYLTIWSYFLFDHLPDRWTILGAIIITIAGLVIWARERAKPFNAQ
ncbi:DMT family transporter [Pseudahrensia aquimaris]|uniref:DMT family transporter n=1 Tax=Pseudahrensia aquimaris TaxID=744461 RepID=A0ABW3FLZ5_9HYPH